MVSSNIASPLTCSYNKHAMSGSHIILPRNRRKKGSEPFDGMLTYIRHTKVQCFHFDFWNGLNTQHFKSTKANTSV